MYMKAKFVAIILVSMGTLPLSADSAPAKQPAYSYGVADVVKSSFLVVAGAWLAHKQLPRLAGQQIAYNAPLFTKVFASLLFAIGSVGGTVGAYNLWNMICERRNA
jgi:hypothetical protein